MIHIGIDHHKKYSHVVALTDSGKVCWDGELASDREAFMAITRLGAAAGRAGGHHHVHRARRSRDDARA